MRFSSLEDAISPDNQVRFIDAFGGHIDLCRLGFGEKMLKTEGRQSNLYYIKSNPFTKNLNIPEATLLRLSAIIKKISQYLSFIIVLQSQNLVTKTSLFSYPRFPFHLVERKAFALVSNSYLLLGALLVCGRTYVPSFLV